MHAAMNMFTVSAGAEEHTVLGEIVSDYLWREVLRLHFLFRRLFNAAGRPVMVRRSRRDTDSGCTAVCFVVHAQVPGLA